MPKRWTPHEDAYLRQWYPIKGPAHCTKRLQGRTQRAVENRAQRLGVISGQPPGYVPLTWVAPRADGRNSLLSATAAAKADGVFKRMPGRNTRNLVPVEWAEKYAERVGERKAQAAETQMWLTTSDVARMVNRSPNTLRRSLSNAHSVGRWLLRVSRVTVDFPQRHHRWHPEETRAAIRAWRAAK